MKHKIIEALRAMLPANDECREMVTAEEIELAIELVQQDSDGVRLDGINTVEEGVDAALVAAGEALGHGDL